MHPSRDWVALILAIGLCTALNAFVFFAIYDAITDPTHAGLSENATQILTGWGGGIIGILGTVFGVRLGTQQSEPPADTRPAPQDQPDQDKRAGLFT